MYKVLIADDEDIIRKGLAGMVSQHPKLEVAALAEDGEVALEMAKKTFPDLMLVDINMPFVDGFHFIEETKRSLPDVLIVIVTGYDDFEFVQKALQLGVANYILKPIMEQPFFAVLDQMVNRLDGMAKSKKYLKWLTRQMEQNRPAMIDDFFRNWLRSNMDQLEIEDRMRYLKIEIPTPYWLTILHLRSDYERDGFPGGSDWDDDLLYFGCHNITKEVFEPYCQALTFRTEDGALAVISPVLPKEQWEELTQKLIPPVEECMCVKVELVQQQGDSVMDFPEVYEQAMRAYRNRQHYSETVLRAISTINKQWGDSELSLQSIADSLYITPQHLSRLFRRETGDTFGAYLTRKRMNEAMRLLQDQNLKMYEIAQKTGYTTQHYFSSAFKKSLGLSPAEYRKNILDQGGGK